MKFKIILFFVLTYTSFNFTIAQESFSFNQGKTDSIDYFITLEYETPIDNFLIVKGSIEGKKYRFLFDTGASCMISEKLFNELNLPVLIKKPIYDSSNLVDTSKIVSLRQVILDGIEFNDVPAIVNINDSSLIFNCFEIDGIIGSNLLRNSIVQFSSKEQVIYITDTPGKLKLNKKHSSNLFLSPNQSSPFLLMTIKGGLKRKVSALFDSGANDFISISNRHFYALNKTKKKRMPFKVSAISYGNNNVGIHGESRDTTAIYRLNSDNLSINKANFNNVNFLTTKAVYSHIGVELIDYGIVTLDYSNGKFYFEPFFDGKKDLSEKYFPISFLIKGNALIVGIVWDNELENKISIGDQVISIDHTIFEGMTNCEIMKQSFSFQKKDEMTITLKSNNGMINSFTLKKK